MYTSPSSIPASFQPKFLPSDVGITVVDLETLGSSPKAIKRFMSWIATFYGISVLKRIEDKKVLGEQALELVKCLCRALESLPSSHASPIYQRALLLAAYNDIHEVVDVITEIFPTAINTIDTKNEVNIFHIVARERSENVFKLLNQMEGKQFFYDCIDSSGNNYMHMCGEQAPARKINHLFSPVVQMQRELQWFKEIEKFVTPSHRTWKNNEGKTPYMLFTEKHQELKSQGEKWMKDTATSCTLVAALIPTAVFAAAFAVPGGLHNDSGVPIFLESPWFIIFAMSNAFTLFSSVTALITFLSIHTSRYAEEDFLYELPSKLYIGLSSLFASITFMMVSFGIAMYITLRHKSNLFLIPAVLLAYFPVNAFLGSQFPILRHAWDSTFRPDILQKKYSRFPILLQSFTLRTSKRK